MKLQIERFKTTDTRNDTKWHNSLEELAMFIIGREIRNIEMQLEGGFWLDIGIEDVRTLLDLQSK